MAASRRRSIQEHLYKHEDEIQTKGKYYGLMGDDLFDFEVRGMYIVLYRVAEWRPSRDVRI